MRSQNLLVFWTQVPGEWCTFLEEADLGNMGYVLMFSLHSASHIPVTLQLNFQKLHYNVIVIVAPFIHPRPISHSFLGVFALYHLPRQLHPRHGNRHNPV